MTVTKLSKVISQRGASQIGQVTSRDRGELITQVGIIGASGVALPPIWVFPRARQNPERMLRGLSSGPIALAHKSGWMTSENFIHVLTFFVKFTRCSKEQSFAYHGQS